MRHAFSRIPHADIPRSSFDRSHGHKTTLNAGLLVPILVDEALPGDTFNVSMTGFARMSTPIKPVMDNSYFTTFFFAVPKRLVWDNWQAFNGEQKAPGDSNDYLTPEVIAPAGGWAIDSLADHFGLPTGVTGLRSNAFHWRAYNLIWNEWFRDQNLQQPLSVHLDDGPDPVASYGLRRRGKRHDYFTSSLPWPQKGESVSIPLGTSAPVEGPFRVQGGTEPMTNFGYTTGNANVIVGAAPAGSGNYYSIGGDVGANNGLFADLTQATASSINQLRQAFAVQRLYERDARGGSRYTELIRSHFGVTSPDARLQRPEYLGGGRSPISIHQVEQTQSSPVDPQAFTPQGNLAAYGTATMRRHGFTKAFTEHCVIIGLVCITADLNYQQGLDRMWSRRRRFDYYWPALSHIGEQAVLSKEIYADGSAGDETVWGYQERFAEYRFKHSNITGKFRSADPQSLDIWHLAQEFATRPLLNEAFIQENPPFDRVVAVPAEPHFIADFHFSMRCARPMPVYGVPGMIDHF